MKLLKKIATELKKFCLIDHRNITWTNSFLCFSVALLFACFGNVSTNHSTFRTAGIILILLLYGWLTSSYHFGSLLGGIEKNIITSDEEINKEFMLIRYVSIWQIVSSLLCMIIIVIRI